MQSHGEMVAVCGISASEPFSSYTGSSSGSFFFFFLNFIWLNQVLIAGLGVFNLRCQHVGSLVVACELLVTACGDLDP